MSRAGQRSHPEASRQQHCQPGKAGFCACQRHVHPVSFPGTAADQHEDDPRQAAMLMRKLSDVTGLKMGTGMEEALSRMERGEDPEKIEAEMGDLLEGEEPFLLESSTKGSRSKKPKPKVDETLYEL